MELCERLWKEQFPLAVLEKFVKILFAVIMLCFVAANAEFDSPSQEISTVGDSSLIIGGSTSMNDDEMKFVLSQIVNPVKVMTEDVNKKEFILLSEETSELLKYDPAADIPGISDTVTGQIVSAGMDNEKHACSEAMDSSADISEILVPQNPAGNGMNSVQDEVETENTEDSSALIPPETIFPENQEKVVDGFLVNESGVIYGVSDPSVIINESYIELPSEGCSGIAAGTFSAGFPSVREIFIPSNITYIEEGAFRGLNNAEWFEIESTGNYSTEEGVLFSEYGTCVLAFPAGRTGNYKVPSRVVRFAAGAFENAQLDMIDAASCMLEDMSGIPAHIELLTGETP